MNSSKTLLYTLESMTPVSDSVYQLILNPPENDALHFIAGQYILLGREQGERQPYSIANAPIGGKHIELHVRHSPDNLFIQSVFKDLTEDKPVTLEGAFGQCIYQTNQDKPIIFMAGGTGFSQSKALIEEITTQESDKPCHLFWVAKSPADLYLASLAHEWAATLTHFQFTPIISNLSEGWQGCTERIEKAVVDNYPDLSNHIVYASGPQDMVFTALHYFEDYGFTRECMFSDAFAY